MDTKKFVVFFSMIASVLLLVATIAATTDVANIESVKINDIEVYNEALDVGVIAGELMTVKVVFEAAADASDVRIKAHLEGEKEDVYARSESFDVIDEKRYSKTLTLKVPYDLKDDVSGEIALNMKIWNGDYKTELSKIVLSVQRPTYNVEVMSIDTLQTVEAGDTLPVNVVLRNMGYNDLDSLYVTAKISALGVERTSYFGDLVADEAAATDDDDTDTVSGKFYLEIPYEVQTGVYALEIEAKNSDLIMSEVTQIFVENDFSTGNVIVTSLSKNVAVGENAEYSLLLVNPTNKLKLYRVVTESNGYLSTSASEAVVAVAAGSSRVVTIMANADSSGDYEFGVNVFSGEDLVSTVVLEMDVEGSTLERPVVVATVILAIIFVVLLVVLIVLLGKKPEKTEEFGESYY